MIKWVERGICILVGISIAFLLLGFRDINKPNSKKNDDKKKTMHTLLELEEVFKGKANTIDDRIDLYLKKYKNTNYTKESIKEAMGESYDLIKDNDVDKVGVKIVADDIREKYTVQYMFQIEEQLYKLELDIRLSDDNDRVEEIKFGSLIEICQ